MDEQKGTNGGAESESGETTPQIASVAPESLAADAGTNAVDAEGQVAQLKDLLLRKAAEFENYKRRAENEAATIIRFANEDLISAVLPILDDFERSLKLDNSQKDPDAFRRGIELIYQKMVKVLETQGVVPFETVGKKFDVHYHDALLQIPRSDVPPHTVIEEVEKGYTLHGRVLRHANVIVSTEAPSPEESGPGNQPPRE
jgi:molecular chaperone GrpE